jgi:hypothetical protein
VQRQVCEYLESKNYLFWRHNNQPTFDPKLNNGHGGYRAQSKWTPKGLPDVMVIHKEKYGQLWGLEIKKPKGGSISPDQLFLQKRFRLHNAEYHIVRSVEEVAKLGL